MRGDFLAIVQTNRPVTSEIYAEIIEKLENRGYINDTNYLLNHVEKMMETGEGKNKIIQTSFRRKA